MAGRKRLLTKRRASFPSFFPRGMCAKALAVSVVRATEEHPQGPAARPGNLEEYHMTTEPKPSARARRARPVPCMPCSRMSAVWSPAGHGCGGAGPSHPTRLHPAQRHPGRAADPHRDRAEDRLGRSAVRRQHGTGLRRGARLGERPERQGAMLLPGQIHVVNARRPPREGNGPAWLDAPAMTYRTGRKSARDRRPRPRRLCRPTRSAAPRKAGFSGAARSA
jgi:hypothetical protein